MTRAGAHAEAIEPFRRAVARDADKPRLSLQPRRVAAIRRRAQGRRSASTAQALRLDPTLPSRLVVARAGRARAADAGRDRDARARARGAGDRRRRGAAPLPRAREAARGRGPIRSRVSPARARQAPQGRDARLRLRRRPRRCSRLRNGCRAALAGRDGDGCDSREPIFIVGMPRTGTTLVERILSSHPQRVLRRRAHELRARAEARDGHAVEPRARCRDARRPARAATSRPSARPTSRARGRARATRRGSSTRCR